MSRLNPRAPTADELTNRRKLLRVSRRDMLDILTGRAVLDIDLPDDAAIVEVHSQLECQGFVLIIWSASFPTFDTVMDTITPTMRYL